MSAIVHCFTSFTFSYLPRALILVQTLRAIHPEWTVWAVVPDEPPNSDDCGLSRAFDHVIYANQLGFPQFHSWLFKHDIVEASTAVKGEMLHHLLENGVDKVIYLDPDIAVFNSFDEIVDALDVSSIILTPHQVHANHSAGLIRDNEMTSLQYGVYNLGFAAVRNDVVGRQFADWWRRQLYFACYDDVKNGIFTDQKWCDLVPSLFERVRIERDPGYNVASWNLSTRRMHISRDGNILINDSPLKFFHFTKINTLGDLMIEKNAPNNTEVWEIWNWYKRALRENDILGIPKGYWKYGSFDNGISIPKAVRVLFRGRADLIKSFQNPFCTNGDSFFNWLTNEQPDLLNCKPGASSQMS
jgi:hypothetical protein